jgi:hypothetical protein
MCVCSMSSHRHVWTCWLATCRKRLSLTCDCVVGLLMYWYPRTHVRLTERTASTTSLLKKVSKTTQSWLTRLLCVTETGTTGRMIIPRALESRIDSKSEWPLCNSYLRSSLESLVTVISELSARMNYGRNCWVWNDIAQPDERSRQWLALWLLESGCVRSCLDMYYIESWNNSMSVGHIATTSCLYNTSLKLHLYQMQES